MQALAAGPTSPSAAAEAAAAARVRVELEAKERAVSAGMHALEEMRRRVEEDRSAVDRQMLRMHELGQKVREDSERLADQARTLRALAVSTNAGSPTQRSGAPSPVRGQGGVYTVVPGGPVQAVDDAFAPEGFGVTGSYGVEAGMGGGGYYGAAGSPGRRYGGGVALSSPPAAAAGSGTAELLFEPEVMLLFDRYRKPLAGLWQLYASLSAPSGDGLPEGVDARRFLELFADYDIAPTFITRRELRQIFVAAARAHGTLGASAGMRGSPGGPDGLDASRVGGDVAGVLPYAGFVEALGRAALASLSKPAFAHLYPTARDKVLVLLEMWGLADVRKLTDMQHRPRKAAAAGGAYGEEAPGSPGHMNAYGSSGAGAMPVF
jgi:hypothetical protein